LVSRAGLAARNWECSCKSAAEDSALTALERLFFYSSLPCGRAKQIVPALFSKILWDGCEIFS